MVMSTKFSGFDNRECPVCGKFPYHAVVCHMHQANICMSHCYENGRCNHQEVICGQAHCTYKETPEQARAKAMEILAKIKGLPP
nr:MAG TPA: Protein involved in formate dehydrogenase formation [Caudoviricetes sp.]